MKNIVLLFFLLSVLPTMSFSDNKTLSFTENSWPPFFDQNMPGGGIALELLRDIFNQTDYNIDYIELPWTRVLNMVEAGEIEFVAGLWANEKMRSKFIISDPYLVNRVVFIKRKDDPFEYNGIDSLTGKTIATVQDYNYIDEFLAATNFSREPHILFIQNAKMVNAGRVDLTLEDQVVAVTELKKSGGDLINRLALTKSALNEVGLHIGCGIKTKNCQGMINIFNSALAKYKDSGAYENFMNAKGL